jgi:RHS repeat-associated protein
MASSRNFSLAFGQSTTYASSSVNAYTSISGGGFQAPSPTYDPNGNTLTLPRPDGSSQALTWDAFDRLRSASNTQSQISKVYDPLGRLVWIRSIQSGQTAKDEIWSWTGWTLLTREVRQGSTTLDTFRYIWGPDLSTTLEGAGGVGGLLAIEHAPGNSTTWDIRYVHYDANGNVIALTDSSGSTSARYRYSPFGELIASEDLDNSGWNDRNIHRFSTKPEVTGTGLLYYGYRYYDPQTGRWPSRDPIGEEGGVNLYGFVENNGVNDFDYHGMMSWFNKFINKRIASYLANLALGNRTGNPNYNSPTWQLQDSFTVFETEDGSRCCKYIVCKYKLSQGGHDESFRVRDDAQEKQTHIDCDQECPDPTS